MQTNSSVIYFPKQSKFARSSKRHPKEKCTVLEWVRNRKQKAEKSLFECPRF